MNATHKQQIRPCVWTKLGSWLRCTCERLCCVICVWLWLEQRVERDFGYPLYNLRGESKHSCPEDPRNEVLAQGGSSSFATWTTLHEMFLSRLQQPKNKQICCVCTHCDALVMHSLRNREGPRATMRRGRASLTRKEKNLPTHLDLCVSSVTQKISQNKLKILIKFFRKSVEHTIDVSTKSRSWWRSACEYIDVSASGCTRSPPPSSDLSTSFVMRWGWNWLPLLSIREATGQHSSPLHHQPCTRDTNINRMLREKGRVFYA